MWKQLFSEAPPGALENLLSPRRKALYAFFALAPGTSLGLYLYSVKLQMERDNERLRLEQVNEELHVERAREQKDAALMDAIREMRARLRALEEQAAGKQATADATKSETAAAAASMAMATRSTDAPTTDDTAILTATKPSEAKAGSGAASRPSGGVNDRVRMRQQEQLKRDVKAFKAAQTAPDS